MGFLSGLRRDLEKAKRDRMAKTNGRHLKEILRLAAQERDRIEQDTGVRPPIDDTTRLYMQKVLNVWISEGRDIDDLKFWHEVDYNRQFDHPVEYYHRRI